MNRLFAITLLLLISCRSEAQTAAAATAKDQPALDQSEAMAKQYLESFKKTGVPTASAVLAAVEKAKQQGTIDAWTEAAAIANAFANVVDVLTDHYSGLYYASRSGSGGGTFSYISKAADYEKIRNRYLAIRNNAYLELAKLYAAKGDKAKALSFVVTAVSLSGTQPNTEGEALIKQYIELSE